MILDIKCKNKRVSLKTLKAGDVFIYDGSVCMKTSSPNTNAIGLQYGEIFHLWAYAEVELIEDARICGTSSTRNCGVTSSL